MDERGREFAAEISAVQSANKAAIKDTLDRLAKSGDMRLFWRLSKQIRLCSHADLKPLLDQIMKCVNQHRQDLLSAAFAGAHVLRAAHFIGQNDAYKWCRAVTFPENPLFAARLYNILAVSTFANVLPPQFHLLDVNHELVQREAAAALARSSKTPANFLRRVLATVAERPCQDVERLSLGECDDMSVRNRGLLMVACFLMSNSVKLADYMSALSPILMATPKTESERRLCGIAQVILAKLMMSAPWAFHAAKVIDMAVVQVKNGTLMPEFLAAILRCYGLFGVRNFAAVMMPRWIDAIHGTGMEFIAVAAPYAMFLEPDVQLDLHKALVERCARRPFDEPLFFVTAEVMLSSAPTVSPYIGSFMDAANRSSCRAKIMHLLTPILEPKAEPIMHPMRDVMKIKETEKKDTFTQATPLVKSVILQCDRTREIVAVPVQRPQVVIPAAPNKQQIEIPVQRADAEPEIDLGDDIEIDLDAPPDSDDQQ